METRLQTSPERIYHSNKLLAIDFRKLIWYKLYSSISWRGGNELRKSIDGVSQKVLTDSLRQLNG